MALFHHQETVINPAHIVAVRTEHSLSGGRFVVAIDPVGGGSSRIQLIMTVEERGRLVEAMEAVSHDYNIAVAPDYGTVPPEAMAILAEDA
jgi:hypothetical protein